MLKINKKNVDKLINRDIIIALIVLVVGIIVLLLSIDPYKDTASNYCRATGTPSGKFTSKVNVTETSSYIIWARVETPVPINFNYSPGEYNPIYLSIDNTSCLDLGENQPITLNAWSWVSATMGGTTEKINMLSITKGVHSFSISGLYSNIDEVVLLKNNCIPVNDGSNCLPTKGKTTYIPN